jgi:hypothetical protein
MYNVVCTPYSSDRIKEFSLRSPSVYKKFDKLLTDPFTVAKPTNQSETASYYVNAGRFCFLIDIIEESKTVLVHGIYYKEHVYKLLNPKKKTEA